MQAINKWYCWDCGICSDYDKIINHLKREGHPGRLLVRKVRT